MRHKTNSGVNDGVYGISKDVFKATYFAESPSKEAEDSETKTSVSEVSCTDVASTKIGGPMMMCQPYGLLQMFHLLGNKISGAIAMLGATSNSERKQAKALEDRKRKLVEEIHMLKQIEEDITPAKKRQFIAKRLQR